MSARAPVVGAASGSPAAGEVALVVSAGVSPGAGDGGLTAVDVAVGAAGFRSDPADAAQGVRTPAAGPGWLLALHSSTDTLGVALQGPCPPGQEPPEPQLAAFPLGRSLANQLLACVEELLPAPQWPKLGRLAVATGPGGFTGTRLTVVLARTLAQQLSLPLDGVSSFQLIARRLLAAGTVPDEQPFRLVQDLPRRGLVAGLYRADAAVPGGVAELSAPRLYGADHVFAEISHPALAVLPEDVAGLLAVSRARESAVLQAPWAAVLPIYPTSPVQGA